MDETENDQKKVPKSERNQALNKSDFLDNVVGFINSFLLISKLMLFKYIDALLGIAFTNILYNTEYANNARKAPEFAEQFKEKQWFKVFRTISSKYAYHPLQKFENAVRRFDLKDSISAEMITKGNSAFYDLVSENMISRSTRNFPVDLTTLLSISTKSKSAEYLFQQISNDPSNTKGNQQKAKYAKQCYLRGYSRVIEVDDIDDWNQFREELRSNEIPNETALDGADEEDVMLFVLSYKSKEVKIAREMRLQNQDGSPGEEVQMSERKKLTADFLDDFRWSQLVRTCTTLAQQNQKTKIRVWIDRLVMMNVSEEERKRIYTIVQWEDFGLFPYMVCPVVRVYEKNEKNFGTDFWRKLELVLGVAGRGMIVDEYLIRQYDKSIYYGPSLFHRLQNGLVRIGGGTVYIRAVTLAMATAVLTDSVSPAEVNEDYRTKKAVSGWKAWALRTIGEGAYSAEHMFILRKENPFDIELDEFLLIAFWESMVSRSQHLTGDAYIDITFERQSGKKLNPFWHGIHEWLGMVDTSCRIKDENRIRSFLQNNAQVEIYATATGHVASIIRLTSVDKKNKHTLVVDLARFSTAKHGYVTGVAEATGLWNGRLSVLPLNFTLLSDPDVDQYMEEDENGDWVPKYKYLRLDSYLRRLKMMIRNSPIMTPVSICFLFLSILLSVISKGESSSTGVLVFFWMVTILLIVYCVFKLVFGTWPWNDETNIGEQLFHNLLMHGLYDSGIMSKYKKLKSLPYNELVWN